MVQALHRLTNGATNQYQSLACGTERDCLEGALQRQPTTPILPAKVRAPESAL